MEPVSLPAVQCGEGAEKRQMLVIALGNCLDGLDLGTQHDLGTQQALSQPHQCCLHSSF